MAVGKKESVQFESVRKSVQIRETDPGFQLQLCWGFPTSQKCLKNMICESSQCLTSCILTWNDFFFHLLKQNEFLFQTNYDVHSLLMEKIAMRKVLLLLI